MADNTARQTHHLQQIGSNMGRVAEGIGSLGTRQREQGETIDALGHTLDEQFHTLASVQDESRDRLLSGRKKLESAIRKADGKAGRRVTWAAAFAGAIVLAAVAAGTLVFSALAWGLGFDPAVPATVLVLEPVFTLLLTAGLWLSYRTVFELSWRRDAENGPVRNVVVVGAGEAGE